MSDFKINDYILHQEAKRLAEEAWQEYCDNGPTGGNAEDILYRVIDGHYWTVYTYNALLLCAECNTTDGEQWLDDIGLEPTDSLGELATRVAFATFYTAALSYL